MIDTKDYLQKIEKASGFIQEAIKGRSPVVGLILGSGLGVLSDEIEDPVVIKYEDIPGFLVSTVAGHAGELVVGRLNGKSVLSLNGRFHYYEGYPIQEVVLPVRILKKLGIETLIVTNAAGGVNELYQPGDLMIIRDHINFAFVNPLIGGNLDEFGPRFPDASNCYAADLIASAEQSAKALDISIRKGVYLFGSGPSYETPAEVKVQRMLGADAVGMSTVPEVLAAQHAGMKVLGISCISNMAAGILDQPLDHQEVIETTENIKGSFIQLVKSIVGKL